MSLSINNKTIKSLMKDNKEIVKIERVADGKILYEKQNNYSVATIAGSNVTLGSSETHWLLSTGDVKIDWGDGTSDTVNDPTQPLNHSYTDGLESHNIKIIGNVTSLGNYCFYNCDLLSIEISNTVTRLGNNCFSNCLNLTTIIIPDSVTTLESGCFINCGFTSITIPDSVTSLEMGCVYNCINLTSVSIPNSVTSIGHYCFGDCTALVDYQLHWTGNDILRYNSDNLMINTDTRFTIPVGETANYVAKGYPSDKLVERSTPVVHNYTLSVTGTAIIQIGDNDTITATLLDNNVPVSGETLSYEIKHGNTIIDSDTDTTDSNGQIFISYTGAGVGDVDITVGYDSLTETYAIEDCNFYSNDGTGLTGNYSTNVGYISNIQSDTYIDTTFPQIWEMSFEFYRPSTISNRALLFSIGQDSNNCKLIGYNANSTGSEKDLQIYNRSSGSNSNCQKTTTPDYNNEEWTSAKITFNGSKIIFEVGSTVLECNDNYATNIFKIYSSTYSYLRNIKVKALPSDDNPNYLFYDDASTDKSSDYSYDNLNSFTYVTDHYEANRTLGTAVSTYYSPIYVDDTLPTNFEISVDISVSNMVQYGISVASNHPQTYQNATEFGILANARRETIFSRVNGSGSFKSDYNSNLSTNTYYTFKIKLEGTTLTGTITDPNDVVKYTDNMEVSFAQSHKKWSIIVGENANTLSFKNLKIKALPSYDLSVSASEDIIQNGDTTTLTATLTDNSVPVTGETLSYQIEHGNTVISSGSDTTDNNGQISINYTGDGIGDVDVIVSYGSLLQETYELTDLYYYDTQTIDKGRYSVTTGTANLSYSNNGFKCIGTANVDTFVKNTALTLPTNYEVEFTVTEKFGSHYGGICLDDLLINFGGSDMTFYRLSTITNLGSSSSVLTAGDVFKITMQSNTMKVYRNGTLLKTFNNISNTGVYQHRIYVDRGQTVKDLKVKAL